MYNNIIVENLDKIQIIKLNRPKSLNALSKDLLIELSDCLVEADNNKKVRCVILTGSNKSFSSGADMKEAPESDMPFWAEKKRLLSWKNIENFKKPIIAAVNGWALGGGLELALLCDFIIAGDKAKFGTPEIKVGAFAGDGGTQRIPRLIGKNRALYMQLTGETISGGDSQDSISCNFIKSQAYAPHHHVDDSTGAWVPRRIAGTSAYSYIDYESAITEQNRNIKVIKPELIKDVARQFIKTMGG